MKRVLLLVTGLLLPSAVAGRAPAQSTRPAPFAKPFVVEHVVVESLPDGSETRTEPVTDYYGGSWLVSVRADGSRLIIDFGRREVTEVQTTRGTYWTLGFQQLRDLRERLVRAERPERTIGQGSRDRSRRDVRIEEVRDRDARPLASRSTSARPLRHLRASDAVDVRVGSASQASVDVWLDESIRLSPEGLSALEGFETQALAPADGPSASSAPGELLAAARRKAEGAFPVRTRRTLAATGRGDHVSEDVATRLELLASFPQKLLTIGEGFKRVPSPLEMQVSFAEEEQARMGRGAKK